MNFENVWKIYLHKYSLNFSLVTGLSNMHLSDVTFLYFGWPSLYGCASWYTFLVRVEFIRPCHLYHCYHVGVIPLNFIVRNKCFVNNRKKQIQLNSFSNLKNQKRIKCYLFSLLKRETFKNDGIYPNNDSKRFDWIATLLGYIML